DDSDVERPEGLGGAHDAGDASHASHPIHLAQPPVERVETTPAQVSTRARGALLDQRGGGERPTRPTGEEEGALLDQRGRRRAPYSTNGGGGGRPFRVSA